MKRLLFALLFLLAVAGRAEAQFSQTEISALQQMVDEWLANGGDFGTGAGGGHVIKDEGTARAQRTNLNFVGTGVSCIDDAGNDESECTINPGATTFDLIQSGANTTATMTVGSGASIVVSGTGAITATNFSDADITALAALVCTGGIYRIATNTFNCRTITGTVGQIIVTNGDGVAGVPTLSLDATVVKEDSANTYTTGHQDMRGASAASMPVAPGHNPTLNIGQFGYDSTLHKFEVNIDSVVENVAFESTINALSILSLQDLDQDALPTILVKYEASAGPPAAASCDRAGQIQTDTTTGFLYNCATAGGNPFNVGGQSDGYLGLSDGTNAASSTGGEAVLYATATSLSTTVAVFSLVTPSGTVGTPGSPFATQPANDAVQLVSSSASDTSPDACTLYGTTNGADQSEVIMESVALNGTTPVISTKVDWGKIYAVDCSGFTPVGTITVREDSGDVTITQLSPSFTKAANQDTVFHKPGGGAGATINTLHSFTPAMGEPPAATFCTIGVRNAHPVQNCATGESIYFTGTLNRGYSGGNIIVDVHYAMVTATTNNVEFTTAFERIGAAIQDLDADGFATGIVSSDSTVPGTSGHVKVVTITHTNAQIDAVAVGEMFRLSVQRSTPTGTDAAGDAQIVAVEVRQ